MVLLALTGQVVLGFVVGTGVLWVCSLTVKTEHANLKTAAVYNAVMSVLLLVVLAMGLIYLSTDSGPAGTVLLITTIITVIVSFVLLMRLYAISFLATIWLVIAMWAVQTGIEKLFDWIF